MAKPGLHLVSKGNLLWICYGNDMLRIPSYVRFFFSADPEVSFSLSLFPGGFTIGKPSEVSNLKQWKLISSHNMAVTNTVVLLFSLMLSFPSTIGTIHRNACMQLFSSIPKQLHPYDRASETLFCVSCLFPLSIRLGGFYSISSFTFSLSFYSTENL